MKVCINKRIPSFFNASLQHKFNRFLKTNLHQSKLIIDKYFDFKTGIAGALILGFIVFFINFHEGIGNALIASAKQTTYTLLAGGFMLRLTEFLATSFTSDKLSIAAGTLIPSVISIALTFIVHYIKGTPEPFFSTVPTMVLAPPGFLWWSIRKRKQLKLLSLPAQNKKL